MDDVSGVLGIMKNCILIPVHNEEKSIGLIVKSLKSKGFDIIVIDDGSQDDSFKCAEKQGARVFKNKEKSGKGASIRRGFQLICDENYDGVIMMDGDAQHAVEDIKQFVEAAAKYPQSIIVGNRMQHAAGMPLIRYLTNKFMSFLISLASWKYIPDTQCGYRYIGCDVLRAMDLGSTGFEIETEILMKARKKGVAVYSVPIKTIYQNEESKINPLKDSIRFFVYFFKEIFSQ